MNVALNSLGSVASVAVVNGKKQGCVYTCPESQQSCQETLAGGGISSEASAHLAHCIVALALVERQGALKCC